VHASAAGLGGAADEALWRFAAEHELVLVSKDSDFYHRSILRGAPPKVIWLRMGNASTSEIAELLRTRSLVVRRFLEDDDSAFLALGTG
jgi:predicted nuclease of predicted toxin-antitoxin system